MGRPPMLLGFKPIMHGQDDYGRLLMQFDEYEALRLCDYENLSQEEASTQMNVSRPTFTRIYDRARKKVARAMVELKEIRITGGSVQFDEQWYFCTDCTTSFHAQGNFPPLQCPVCKGIHIESYVEGGHQPNEMHTQQAHDFCVCPKCGHRKPHIAGKPCREQTCTDCGITLVRENSPQHGIIQKKINDKSNTIMKIAIPSKTNAVDAEMDAHFGRCSFFAIADLETGSIEFHANPAKDAEGGAGPKAVEFIAGLGAKRVYSRDFGPKAKAALNAVHIEMVDVKEENIKVSKLIEQIK